MLTKFFALLQIAAVGGVILVSSTGPSQAASPTVWTLTAPAAVVAQVALSQQ